VSAPLAEDAMDNEVRLMNNPDFTCAEKVIATIAHWYGRNYEMIFRTMWNLMLRPDDARLPGRIGGRISLGAPDLAGPLWTDHGIQISYECCHQPDQALRLIADELAEKRLVAVGFDQHYLPWATEKNKTALRFRGRLIITGYEADAGLRCLDVHGSKQAEYLPLSSFRNGWASSDGRIARFLPLKDENRAIAWPDFVASVTAQLDPGDGPGLFARIRCLAGLFSNADFPAEAERASDVENIRLVRAMKDLCRSRILFSLTLRYLRELYQKQPHPAPPLDGWEELFLEAASQWRLVYSAIAKAYYRLEFSPPLTANVRDRILRIADFEEGIAQKLRESQTASQRFPAEPPTPVPEEAVLVPERIIPVPISPYCNNKGFATDISNPHQADLSGVGSFFLMEGLPCGRRLEVGGMRFQLSALGTDSFDNISCRGQIIMVDPDWYQRLMLLGCSEYGAFTATITARYSDGVAEAISVGFSSWGSPQPKFGETVAWSGAAVDKQPTFYRSAAEERRHSGPAENSTVSRYLFAKTFPLKHPGRLETITLPDCPNLHLFAIALEKSLR
jgi:hypothetical protein